MKAKKLLALALALIMALSCLSITAFAEEETPTITVKVTNQFLEANGSINATIGTLTKTDFGTGDLLELSVTDGNTADAKVSKKLSATGEKIDEKDCDYNIKVTSGYDTVTEGIYYVKLVVKKVDNEYKTIATYSTEYIKLYVGVGTYLDLDDTTNDVSDTKTDIKQKYDVKVSVSNTEKTKVQVSWTLQNMLATVTSNKIWDTSKLQWVEDSSQTNSAEAESVTATFNFVNLSSTIVDAAVKFEAITGVTATPTYADADTDIGDSTKTTDGIITLSTKSLGADADNDASVTVTVPADKDYFKTLTASTTTSQKYGTYTVKITAGTKLDQDPPNSNNMAYDIFFEGYYEIVEEDNSGFGKLEYAVVSNDEWGENKLTSDANPTWESGKKIFEVNSETQLLLARYAGDANHKPSAPIQVQDTCFVAGTKITMADGTFKNIEDIVAGDQVLSYDTIKNETYVSTVRHTTKGNTAKVATVTLANGTTVSCTPSHPLYTTDGWKSVNPSHKDVVKEFASTELHIGDKVVTDSGAVAVVSITVADENAEVYTFSVESNGDVNNRNYFANGIVAHNASAE